MEGQEQFKYALYVHGHSQWSSRLRILLAGGRLLMKQLGVCDECYATQLKPFVHYLPIDYYWRNLTEAVEWARSHDDEAKQMVLRMNRYADSVVGSTLIVAEYVRRILRGYHDLMEGRTFTTREVFTLDEAVAYFRRKTAHENIGL
jgi:hypothetical protein